MAARTDKASRRVAASPDAIYAAFVDPDALMAWLPPAGMTGRALLFEPWQSGRYRIALSYEGEGQGKTADRTDISAGRFLALEPARRIAMAAMFESDDPAFAGEMILTWALVPAPGGTDVTVTAEKVPAGISAEDHEAGLASSLENLARLVE